MTRHGYSNHDTWRLARDIGQDAAAHEYYAIMATKAHLHKPEDPAGALADMLESDYLGCGYGYANYYEIATQYLQEANAGCAA